MEKNPLTRPQRSMLWTRLGIRLLILIGVILAVLLLGTTLLELCMPFVFALIFTAVTEPILRFFHDRCKIPRGILSLVLILLVVAALGGLITALVVKGWREVVDLAGNWDEMWAAFQNIYLQLGDILGQTLNIIPENIQEIIHNLSDRLLAWVNDLASRILPKTTSAARSISSFVVAFFFFLIGWYFMAADYPNLRRMTAERTPESIRRIGSELRRAFAAAFGGYLKAELLISAGVTVILMVGFFLMGQPYGILLALLLGVLDFIPILGAGTVMVPWLIIDAILGNWRTAIYLLVIWGIICLFRRLLEPKIVGDQTGLHPLLSLLAIYAGMRTTGVLGMILAPILLIMVRNLWQAGMFRDSVGDIAMATNDMQAILHSGRDKN
ncbi:MAG: sporulation integral membrane protein YtvI [Ruminiclostridium sp.]|nr:sporulation integral membrane protein YtvI [Ruminiclostridium sp.]